MENNIKKIIATVIVTGALVGGGFVASDKANCDYVVEYKGEEVCFTQEEKEVIESRLKPNEGFGGMQFK